MKNRRIHVYKDENPTMISKAPSFLCYKIGEKPLKMERKLRSSQIFWLQVIVHGNDECRG